MYLTRLIRTKQQTHNCKSATINGNNNIDNIITINIIDCTRRIMIILRNDYGHV